MAAHHARTLALRPLCRIGVPHPRRGRVSAVPSTPLVAAKVAAKVSEGAKQQRLICRADMKSGVEIDGRIGARWEELVLELREWRKEGKVCICRSAHTPQRSMRPCDHATLHPTIGYALSHGPPV
jgi:hypothetical protein